MNIEIENFFLNIKDLKNQIVTTNAWFTQKWIDYRFKWVKNILTFK